MKIEHLKIFMEVAQSESINKAAGKLFTSHQNLNVLMKKLEEELDTKLFVRSNKGIALSDEGKELLDAATQIIAIYDDFQSKIKKETGILNFYTTTSLTDLINDLQGCCFCSNYISVHKKNVDEIYALLESKKKGIYFVSVSEKDFKKLDHHKDHCIVASDDSSVRVYHKNNPLLSDNPSGITPRSITNISQSQLATEGLINIDDIKISKKLMKEEHFIFTTTESLARAYFPEDEWIMQKEPALYPVKFTVFFNLPNTPEWREARSKITERIRKNFKIIEST